VAYALPDKMKIINLGWPWRTVRTVVAKWCDI